MELLKYLSVLFELFFFFSSPEVTLFFFYSDTAAKVMVELLGSYTEDNASQARVDAHR